MRNPVKMKTGNVKDEPKNIRRDNGTSQAKPARKRPAKKTAKKKGIKWVGKGDKAAASNVITGGHYDLINTDDGVRLDVITQTGGVAARYLCRDVSTAELLVTLMEDGRLYP